MFPDVHATYIVDLHVFCASDPVDATTVTRVVLTPGSGNQGSSVGIATVAFDPSSSLVGPSRIADALPFTFKLSLAGTNSPKSCVIPAGAHFV